MRGLVTLKASKDSEADVMPSEKLLKATGKALEDRQREQAARNAIS